jgi:PAP2 superfamily
MTPRLILAPPLVAIVTLVAALIATAEAGVAFRDPDNVAVLYILEVGAGVALLIALDIYLRAGRRTNTRRPSRAAMEAVRRERWTRRRVLAVIVGVVSFYVAYLAYRNLKGVIPLLRPGDLFDRELLDADRALFLGTDPETLLHDLLGTGVAAHILSAIYAAFIVFLPLSLGVALVFVRDLQVSLFYATTLSLNWIIGAATYLLLPALGPIYAFPEMFTELPRTLVTHLQEMLLDDRVGWLADPGTGTPQAIAAFASLHIAMSFSAVLAAHALRADRRLIIALWTWLVLTWVATIYLGWHYVLDDVAGLAIGALAFALARSMTGYSPRAALSRPAASSPRDRPAGTSAGDPETGTVAG